MSCIFWIRLAWDFWIHLDWIELDFGGIFFDFVGIGIEFLDWLGFFF